MQLFYVFDVSTACYPGSKSYTHCPLNLQKHDAKDYMSNLVDVASHYMHHILHTQMFLFDYDFTRNLTLILFIHCPIKLIRSANLFLDNSANDFA